MESLSQDYPELDISIINGVKKFRELNFQKPIRIISHYDSDGISACSILCALCRKEKIRFKYSILTNLLDTDIEEYAKEENEIYFFTDLGSGSLNKIMAEMKEKTVFILDHHIPDYRGEIPENITLINPENCNISGSTEVSASGITYLFAERVNSEMLGFIHLGLVGALGDMQATKGLIGLNRFILRKSEESGAIKVLKGEDTPEINHKKNISGYYADYYRITIKNEDSPDRSVNELSTFLNACGKLQKEDIAIKICLGVKIDLAVTARLLKKYKTKIFEALEWFRNNLEEENFPRGEKFVILDAEKNISYRLIGTISSIISRMKVFENETVIISMADNKNTIKMSLRICGDKIVKNLRDFTTKIGKQIPGSIYGGHNNAAGIVAPIEFKEKIIELVKKEFSS